MGRGARPVALHGRGRGHGRDPATPGLQQDFGTASWYQYGRRAKTTWLSDVVAVAALGADAVIEVPDVLVVLEPIAKELKIIRCA